MIDYNSIKTDLAQYELDYDNSFTALNKLAPLYCAMLYHTLSDPRNVPVKGDSEFYKIISNKNLTAVLGVINELLEAIKCININLYQATLQKLVNLD